jgi:hypothetical protein
VGEVVEVTTPSAHASNSRNKKSNRNKRKRTSETQTQTQSQPQSLQYSPLAKRMMSSSSHATVSRYGLSQNVAITPHFVELLKHLGFPLPTDLQQNRSVSAPHGMLDFFTQDTQADSPDSQEESQLDSQPDSNDSVDEDDHNADTPPRLEKHKIRIISPPTSPSSLAINSPSLGAMQLPSPSNSSVSTQLSSASSVTSDEELYLTLSPQLSSSSSDYLNRNILQIPYSNFFSRNAPGSPKAKTQPTLFPELFVLNRYYQHIKDELGQELPDLSNVVFACGQHLLNTTGSLFQMLIGLGAKPKNIFVIGKSYSNCQEVIEGLRNLKVHVYEGTPRDTWGDFAHAYGRDVYSMWNDINKHIESKRRGREAIESIIVLDDGGHVLQEMTASSRLLCRYNVGIEQTTSGTGSAATRSFPVIQVCSAAIKNWCEPPMVSAIVAQKLRTIINKRYESTPRNAFKDVYGIVGFGHIGESIMNELLHVPYRNILIFDNQPLKREHAKAKFAAYPNVEIVETIDGIYQGAEVIIGCTGKDITMGKSDAFDYAPGPRVLISCSSKDVEFNSLLLKLQEAHPAPKNPLDDIVYTNKLGNSIRIAKGGLPINFDNTLNSVPPNEIQLIRGLKLAAIFQAAKMIQDWKRTDKMQVRNYQVDAATQQWLFHEWIKTNPEPKCWKPFVKSVSDFNEILRKSGGYPYVSPEEPIEEASSQLVTRLRM